MRRFNAFAGQIVEVDGDNTCTCGAAVTHVLIRPIDPDRWIDQREMSVLARGYCDACSPAVDPTSVTPRAPAHETPLMPPTILERLIARWFASEQEADHAAA